MLKTGVTVQEIEKLDIKRYALVMDGVCIGVILWNGNTDTWTPPIGVDTVELNNISTVCSGWVFSNNTWIPPQPLEEAI